MDNFKPVMPQQGPTFGIPKNESDSLLERDSSVSEKPDDIQPPRMHPEMQAAKRDFDQTNPYYHVLNMVIDPEVGVGIVDMGLIYHVEQHEGVVVVTMTLTSMGCPAGPQLTTDVDAVLRMQDGVKDVEIEVVWDPAWNPEMMNPEIRQMLFGGF